MSWSFHIKNGDLNLSGPGGFAVVTGTQKLIQDIKNWLLEPRGTDPINPGFGSILDGGSLPDGSQSDSMLGTVSRESLIGIESEIRRILSAYQQQQLLRLQRETIQLDGKNTFAAGEILASVNEVTVDQIGDIAVARIFITTQSGQPLSFSQPVGVN